MTRVERVFAESEAAAPSSRVSIHDVVLALRRHRWLIAAVGFLGAVGGLIVFCTVSPRFVAESSLVIDARHARVVDLPSIVSEQTTNPEVPQLRSEVEVLESPDLAARVIAQLGLAQNPAFHPEHSQLKAHLLAMITDVLAKIPYASPWADALRSSEMLNTPWAPDPLGDAVQIYRQNLSVANDGRSYIIRVRFTSGDPQLAARIVNTHIQLYLQDQVAFKQEAGKQASAWLVRELANLQAKLRTSEDQVQQFREENHIAHTSGGTTLISQQLAAVNGQLPIAQSDLANATSRLQQIKELSRRGTLETVPEVLQSQAIQRLRDQEALLISKRGDLTAQYGPQHPTVIKMNAEMADLRAAIQKETGRITASIQNEVDVAHSRVAALQSRLAELQKESVYADRAEAKLRDLEREVSANSSLIEVLLNRYKQVSAQEGIQQPDARVVSAAAIPGEPSFPKLRTLLPVSTAIGLLLGAVLGLLRELLRPGFKGSQQIELECELPSLGSVPMIPRAFPRLGGPPDLVVDRPRSDFAEAIRYVRNAMLQGELGEPAPKTFLITSSVPHEGKTTLAISLGRSFAQAGRKVLIVDCDVRRPSVAAALCGAESANHRTGITSVLAGKVGWRDTVQRDDRSRLDFIPAGPCSNETHDLLASNIFPRFIEECRREYELVLVDSPPITAVPDALTLSRSLDGTILAVRWGATPREIAKTSLNKLFMNGARLCGVVLTAVDMRKGIFSPADPEYYHGRNRKYYVG